jgi:hypothetical protein
MLDERLVVALALLSGSCAGHGGGAPTSTPPATAPAAPSSAPAASASVAAPPARAGEPGRPCGALGCLAFSTPQAAFERALASNPRIVALGEAHAQKDTTVKSTTRRFAEELLPGIADRVSDLVVELLTTNGSCGKAVEKDVADRQKPVTEPQAAQNQNQYITLGVVSKKLGIAPHALAPECDELHAVSAAGEGDIERMLVMIADATVRETEKLLATGDPKRSIVLYGGALHNDIAPRAGHEAWSYGPRLSQRVGGRYVEIDLVVPELVKPTPAWQAFAWYSAFEALGPSDEAVLYELSPASYVLIFPRSPPPPPPATSTAPATVPP